MTVNEATIKEIADMLGLGMRCYLHKQTAKHHIIASEEQWDYMDEDEQAEQQQELDKINDDMDSYIEFEPMFPREAFQIMFDFADSVDDESLKNKLMNALDRNKPFRRFKDVLDYADGDYRQQWFDFEANAYMDYVKEIIAAD